ncbi:MAG: DUF2807 domain-containing protein [Betaproteobacteria bacterium]|nr:DUF2807 domain-containing protein [Betaproteobacteria bacterium]
MCLAASAGITSAQEVMTRPAAGVTRIVFKTPGELQIRQGTEEKLTVQAEAKVLAQLDISTKNDILTLGSKGNFKTDKGLKYTLTLKSFRSLKTEGSGSSSVEGFAGPEMDFEGAGSGDISIKNIKPGRMNIVIKGSSNIDVSGSGKQLIARIDGSGTIDAVKFQAQAAEARIDGSGNISVNAEETLKATIGGAGNIEYKGKAKVTQSITGAGNINRL